jgi:hypothetical protein
MLSSVAEVWVGALAAALALILLTAAIHKVVDRRRMVGVMKEFGRIRARWAGIALILIVALELGAGLILLRSDMRLGGAIIAALLWGGYAMLLLRAVSSGRRHVDCGCGFQSSHKPIGYIHVARTLVLAVMAVAIVAGDRVFASVTFHPLLDFAAGCGLFAVYGAWNALLDLRTLGWSAQ